LRVFNAATSFGFTLCLAGDEFINLLWYFREIYFTIDLKFTLVLGNFNPKVALWPGAWHLWISLCAHQISDFLGEDGAR
jgi:hypothetical protein